MLKNMSHEILPGKQQLAVGQILQQKKTFWRK